MLRDSKKGEGIYITPDLTVQERKDALEVRNELKNKREESKKNEDGRWLDHQERAGCGERVAATKVRKTSTKEKIKAQNTSEIGTEIEHMHEKIVEVNQEMEFSLIPNDKGVQLINFVRKN